MQVLGTFITEWVQGALVCRALLATAESCFMFAFHLAELAYELGFDGWLVEDRAHHQRQKNFVNIYLFVAKGTIDVKRWQSLSKSLKRVSTMTDGVEASL